MGDSCGRQQRVKICHVLLKRMIARNPHSIVDQEGILVRLDESSGQSVVGLEIRIGTVVVRTGTSELIERRESCCREIPERAEREQVRMLEQQVYASDTGFGEAQEPVLFRAC